MTNIQHKVWEMLDHSPSIRRELGRGLINFSALARYIIKEKNIDVPLDGVISAIRRYELDKPDDIFKKAFKILDKTVTISTKINLVEITLLKDDEIQQLLSEVFSQIRYSSGDVLRITQANEAINLLIDDKNLEKIIRIFPKNKIVAKITDLAEINIYIPPNMQNTPGIIAVIANELAINEINAMEIMTCPPEMIWVVNKEDLTKAADILFKLCEHNK